MDTFLNKKNIPRPLLKKVHLRVGFLVIIFLSAMVLSAQSSVNTLYVAVKTVEVKASSGFFAGVLGTLNFGDAVTLQQSQGKWIVIRNASGLQGWAPADAFSARRVLPSGSGVSATEFALAGKGFSSDLEKVLVSSGAHDYSGVDAMEKRTVSAVDLRTFLKEGRLTGGE